MEAGEKVAKERSGAEVRLAAERVVAAGAGPEEAEKRPEKLGKITSDRTWLTAWPDMVGDGGWKGFARAGESAATRSGKSRLVKV